MRRFNVMVYAACVVLALAAAAWVWFASSGDGTSKDSPDGRYNAESWNRTRRTWDGQRLHYITLTVTERDSGWPVWQMEYRPLGHWPAQQRRGRETEWAADSSSVTFRLDDRAVTVPVP